MCKISIPKVQVIDSELYSLKQHALQKYFVEKRIQRIGKKNRSRANEGERRPVVRFTKVPKLFGLISSDIIDFVSSNRRCLETRKVAVI